MSAQLFILLMACIKIAYGCICSTLASRQRKQPLPDVVADVYDAERYAEYLQIVAEDRRAHVIYRTIDTANLACFLYSPFFVWAEQAAHGNAYLVVALTLLVIQGIAGAESFAYEWYLTFHIDDKHGLNNMDAREFVRTFLLDELPSAAAVLLAYEGLAFVGEHMAAWTDGFSLGMGGAILLTLGLFAAAAAFEFASSLVGYKILKKQYTLTPMPEGPLRSKIMALTKGSRKKLAQIYVYDESKKSVEINAMLVKLPWRKELWIADNALSSADERTTLAVVSHEIGHLKHRWRLMDALGVLPVVALILLVAALIANPSLVFGMNAWVLRSFGLSACNYILLATVAVGGLLPIAKLLGAFSNAMSRHQEYEADREAVHNGYAAELAGFLKVAERKELMNVNPHPFIEFMEYDHPGLCNRLTAIWQADAARETSAEDASTA